MDAASKAAPAAVTVDPAARAGGAVWPGAIGDTAAAGGALSEPFGEGALARSAEAGSDSRMASSGPAEPAPARGDGARGAAAHPAAQAAAQVAEALRAGTAASGRVLEVTLQPEELGRVRFVFSQSEAGLTVTVHAERPEVLDMLRRNIDLLGEDLARQGHADVAFDFAGGGDGPAEDDAASAGSASTGGAAGGGPDPAASDPTRSASAGPAAATAAGLDLRL